MGLVLFFQGTKKTLKNNITLPATPKPPLQTVRFNSPEGILARQQRNLGSGLRAVEI